MIIAEIGTSHGGSIEKCRQLIKASVESGADAVSNATGGMSAWTWIIWIIVIVIIIIVLWWLFAGNKGNGRGGDNN